ncbi:MAG: hypothetical protein EOL86_09160 [Deltaproteobacteria bacterium]|nr:hypothetical protein [Deltaproteobacteria bacterium]
MNPLDLADDLLDFDLDQEIPGFDLIHADISDALQTETVRIRRYPRPEPQLVRYERAADMVAALPNLAEGEAVFALVSGNFIFGDLIEALMVDRNWYAEELLVATLSLSKENVDSLRNLQTGGYVRRLGLVVSDFWYAHERRPAGGVPYIESTLGQDQDFLFAAAGIHTKTTCIRTDCGRSLVLHGSANLRSSRNVEQVMVDASAPLYEFNAAWINRILADFSANPKSKRGDILWQTLPEPTKSPASPTGEKAVPPPVNANPNGADK